MDENKREENGCFVTVVKQQYSLTRRGVWAGANLKPSPRQARAGSRPAVCGDSHRALVLPFKLNANQYAQNVKFEMCEHAQLLESCLTLCNPVDCSPPGSSMHGILQARILEWVVISSSRGASQPKD